MKKFILALAVVGLAFSSQAQFFGVKPNAKEIITSNVTLATAGTTNLTTAAPVGSHGFAVTAYLVGTNSGTANINVQALVSHNGTDYNSTAIDVGNVAMNGTTAVRKTLFIPITTIDNVTAVKLVLTNAHTASVTISNLTVTSFQ